MTISTSGAVSTALKKYIVNIFIITILMPQNITLGMEADAVIAKSEDLKNLYEQGVLTRKNNDGIAAYTLFLEASAQESNVAIRAAAKQQMADLILFDDSVRKKFGVGLENAYNLLLQVSEQTDNLEAKDLAFKTLLYYYKQVQKEPEFAKGAKYTSQLEELNHPENVSPSNANSNNSFSDEQEPVMPRMSKKVWRNPTHFVPDEFFKEKFLEIRCNDESKNSSTNAPRWLVRFSRKLYSAIAQSSSLSDMPTIELDISHDMYTLIIDLLTPANQQNLDELAPNNVNWLDIREKCLNREPADLLELLAAANELDIKMLWQVLLCHIQGNDAIWQQLELDRFKTVKNRFKDLRKELIIKGKPIHLASKYGLLELVKYYVSLNEEIIVLEDDLGRTPLCIAAAYGHPELVDFYVDEKEMKGSGWAVDGANQFSFTRNGKHQNEGYLHSNYLLEGTPLHYACQKANLYDLTEDELKGNKRKIVQCLLRNNYGPSKTTKARANCLHIACAHQDTDFISFLIPEIFNSMRSHIVTITKKPIDDAEEAERGRQEAEFRTAFVRWINSQDSDGRTPLHIACARRLYPMVDALFSTTAKAFSLPNNGALINANLYTGFGMTPMHEALQKVSMPTGVSLKDIEEIVKLLKERGGNCHLRDYRGKTPLHVACKNGFSTIAISLLRESQDEANNTGENTVNPISDYVPDNMVGTAALHHAAAGGHLDLVSYLVNRCQADISCESILGSTPLHYAIYYHRDSVVLFLAERTNNKDTLSYCRFPNSSDAWGSPLHVVEYRYQDSELLDSLKAEGFTSKTPSAFNKLYMDIYLKPTRYILIAVGAGVIAVGVWKIWSTETVLENSRQLMKKVALKLFPANTDLPKLYGKEMEKCIEILLTPQVIAQVGAERFWPIGNGGPPWPVGNGTWPYPIGYGTPKKD